MKNLNPASQIFFGLSFLVSGSGQSGWVLGGLAVLAAVLALQFGRPQFLSILRRSRWLLLTMLILFSWLTPGTWIAGMPGVSKEGLLLAAENMARLTIAIASVAILLKVLEPSALVAGLRTLLGPLSLLGNFRDRLAVRLVLTLDAVDAGISKESEVANLDRLALPSAGLRVADVALISGGVAMLAFAFVP